MSSSYLVLVAPRCHGSLMMRAQLSVHNRIRQLKVRLRLLVPLQNEHTAAQVIIHGCSVYCVAPQSLLAYRSGFEETAQSPSWLVNVVKD